MHWIKQYKTTVSEHPVNIHKQFDYTLLYISQVNLGKRSDQHK